MNIRMLGAALVSAVLVACGGGGGDQPEPPSSGIPNSESPGRPVAGGPTTPPDPTDPTTPTTPVGQFDVSVTGVAPTTAHASGATAAYRFIVSNAGPGAPAALTLAVTADAGLTVGAITCAASGGATCPTAPAATMTTSSLPARGALAFTVNAAAGPTATGAMGVTLKVGSSQDTTPGNNEAKATANVLVPTTVMLQSDAGDFIGGGRSYAYTRANASIGVSATGNRIGIQIDGDENWFAQFQLPSGVASLQPGTYANLTRHPFHDPLVGGLSWSGEGRGCNTLTGSVTVVASTYSGADLTSIDLEFEQHCEGGAAALRGQIHWSAADNSTAPGPLLPVPTNLWQAAGGVTPASGNYVYLISDTGDYIGAGKSYTYTPPTAVTFTPHAAGGLKVAVGGWTGDFAAMKGVGRLEAGYYGGLARYPFHNPVKGGLDWSGNGRGCNELSGWFVVDSVTYDGTTLKAIDLRFEQHCERGLPALRGKIHWVF